MCCVRVVSAVGLGLGVLAARGAVPTYETFQLQCRANFSGAYNLPNGAFFTSSTPALNNAGQVAIKLTTYPGSSAQAIWFGGHGTGGVVFFSQPDALFGSVSLNLAGRAVFEQFLGTQNGIYYYDSAAASGGFLTALPLGATTWSSPQINAAGQVGYRVGFSGPQAWVSYDGTPTVAIHAAEVGLQPTSPYSFLFTPSFNNHRQIAGKVRLGGPGQTGESRPDQIRIFNSDGTSTLIAEDRDSNPASPYTRLDNAVSLTNTGYVAFIATLAAGGRGVFLSNGTETRTIATTTGYGLADIEPFAPAANDAGLVVFRAAAVGGLRNIYVGDGQTLRKVIGEHDLVPTDLGIARIDQHDASPVFGGNPAVNQRGDVAFNAALTPPDNNQIEWGSGLFVAYATYPQPGDLNCDGVVNFDDIDPFVLALSGQAGYEAAYPNCRWLNADCDGDGQVNFDDIDLFVALLSGG